MTILDKIIAYKRKEVEARKKAFPISILKQSELFKRSAFSMSEALRNSKNGIIAEHKRRSPSKSVINEKVSLPEVASGYEKAGVAAMSVLTDTSFFGGSLDDLLVARDFVSTPLLRKEFIIDTYQLYEAKAYGADAVLLIAAALNNSELSEFAKVATDLGLEVLLEVHNEEELERSNIDKVSMIGVNNRNLKTFEVSTENSKRLSGLIPKRFVKVSESGISSIEAISELRNYGYQGFLVGEHFMRHNDPGKAAKQFIQHLL
ncbi:indole-3-glycerol phosphate synthase TrpC [Aureitalea sp. L0-47]|uniref:indole-3-glycerol phosphate synthase TrpC n=1 Tax=Aureitalea sp. L0-47 TaxID=2816962 RepID=UPI0022374F24|nr:indole-3-glycerol phosphate synthase TrpC [Aureitalea sp. L0-47]MCW5520735.1 indole-3-glycerol phosphate synthase TrpC [Aureitalea sp. L0-47]